MSMPINNLLNAYSVYTSQSNTSQSQFETPFCFENSLSTIQELEPIDFTPSNVREILFKEDVSEQGRIGYLDSTAMLEALGKAFPEQEGGLQDSYKDSKFVAWKHDSKIYIYAQKNEECDCLGEFNESGEITFGDSNEPLADFRVVPDAAQQAIDQVTQPEVVSKVNDNNNALENKSEPTATTKTTDKPAQPTSWPRSVWNGVKSAMGAIGSVIWFVLTLPARPFMTSATPTA